MNKNTQTIIFVALVVAFLYRKKIGQFLKSKNIIPEKKKTNQVALTPNQELEREGYIDAIKNSKREYFERVENLDNINIDDIYGVFDELSTQKLKDMYSMNMAEFESEFGQLLLEKYSLSN